MEDKRHCRRTLEEGEGGRKKRGRPKKKWLDAVVSDIRTLGVTDWRREVRNRPAWRRLVNQMEENLIYVRME